MINLLQESVQLHLTTLLTEHFLLFALPVGLINLLQESVQLLLAILLTEHINLSTRHKFGKKSLDYTTPENSNPHNCIF